MDTEINPAAAGEKTIEDIIKMVQESIIRVSESERPDREKKDIGDMLKRFREKNIDSSEM